MHDGVRDVLRASADGEERAAAAVTWAAVWLARGIAALVNLVNPAVVVLGGALAELFEATEKEVFDELDRWALDAPRERVRLTVLGADSVLLGAAELAFEPLLTDPMALMGGGGAARAVSGSTRTAN